MKLLRTVCVLLTCFLLVATQTVFISDAQAGPDEAQNVCACDSCEIMNCCVSSQPSPTPQQPTPVQNPRTVSQTQIQFIATVVALLSEPSTQSIDSRIPASSLHLLTAEVPLYTWNCSYLI
jgi:hypothetical protein